MSAMQYLIGDYDLVPRSKRAELVEAPTSTELWRPISDTAIEVDLDLRLKVPLEAAIPLWGDPLGKVKVERIEENLYVEGKKVILYTHFGQKGESCIEGDSLNSDLEGVLTLHSNILDALLQNQHLIPEYWKVGTGSEALEIFFWKNTFYFSNPDVCSGVFARCIYRYNGSWRHKYVWLEDHFTVSMPTAILEPAPLEEAA